MNITELMEIAEVTKNGETELVAELDKRGFTIEQLKEAFDKVVSVIRQAWKAVKKWVNGVIDGLIFAATNNPKHYHLYKHAKKYRTRKKYRRKLLREMALNMAGGAFV